MIGGSSPTRADPQISQRGAPLELRGVSAGYAVDRPVLHQVDLAVAPGEVVALIGPNGSGKSTLLRVASRVLKPVEGQALLAGLDLWRLPARDVARRLAVVPQTTDLPFGMTVAEMVSLGRTPHLRVLLGPTVADRAAVERALVATEARDLAARFVDELSGGERQRVVLARALAQEPAVLLLDEPTANLDLHHQVATLDLVRGLAQREGLAVLAAIHDLQLAALYADRVALLAGGRIVATGAPERVLEAALLEQVFGQPVALAPHPTHGVPLVALVPNGEARRVPR